MGPVGLIDLRDLRAVGLLLRWQRELFLTPVVAAVSGKGWRKLGELFWRAFFYLTRKTL